MITNPRVESFLSSKAPEIFHSVQHSQDVWRRDPFDVPEIHRDARDLFERMVERAANGAHHSGRILLLRGESGAGKTHLIRSFRATVHDSRRAFFAYMQMTSAARAYGRYVLQNLVDSLDQPYALPSEPNSSLKMLSDSLTGALPKKSVKNLQEHESGPEAKDAVNELTDRLVDRLDLPDLDMDLIRALLFLQVSRPSVKIRVIKYLRGETLSEYDRSILGDMAPRREDEDPLQIVAQLAAIIRKVLGRTLVVCLDQLEDVFSMDSAKDRFGLVMDTVKQLGEIPGAVVVLSCLDTYYGSLRTHVNESVLARIEHDPAPVLLKGERTLDDIRHMVARRLQYLFEVADAPVDESAPTDPIPDAVIKRLRGTARMVLRDCLDYRDQCRGAGKLLPEFRSAHPSGVAGGPPDPDVTLEQKWNDWKLQAKDVPEEENELADLLCSAVVTCGDELGAPGAFFAMRLPQHAWLKVEHRNFQGSPKELLVAVCERSGRGGGLRNQLKEVWSSKDGRVPAIVRSSQFTASGEAGRLVARLASERDARIVVAQTNDWKTIKAFFEFKKEHGKQAAFGEFIRDARPLSSTQLLSEILRIDELVLEASAVSRSPEVTRGEPDAPGPAAGNDSRSAGSAAAASEGESDVSASSATDPPTTNAVSPPLLKGAIRIGQTISRQPKEIAIEPEDLKRHISFIGGTGSGKTTAALSIIEALLARGVSAVLIDRKGDLCGYADPMVWNASLDDAERDEFRAELRRRVAVQVYTPGQPQGRGLRLPLLPPGTAQMEPFDRETAARVSADALANMMRLGNSQAAQGQRAVLQIALRQLSESEDGSTLTLDTLVDYLNQPEDELLVALGNLARFREPLAVNLEILARQNGVLLGEGCEPLDIAEMFGKKSREVGRAQLTIISTKFLSSNVEIQFWVAQFLLGVSRYFVSNPSDRLQAVLMLDEADLYLPATSQPATKGPVEDLLRRARSMGLSVFLATQSPGDMDYRCRDNIRTWLVGLLTQQRAISKLAEMFTESHSDTSNLATQRVGQFHLLAEGSVHRVQLIRNAVKLPAQVSPDRILELARLGRQD